MLLLLLFFSLFVVGIIIMQISDILYDIVGTLTVFSLLCFFILLISIPISRTSNASEIQEFKIMRQILDNAENNNPESATIQIKIIEHNQWLASMKYYNQSIWDIWIPDEIENLKYIK